VSVSAAIAGADSIIVHAAANAVKVANLYVLVEVLGWLMAFIETLPCLFSSYLSIGWQSFTVIGLKLYKFLLP
jgi:hypothetical protein